MEYWKNLDLADIRYFCEERNDWFVEEWRDIPKWKGLYQVSDLGRLKSFRLKEVKVLRQSFTNKGYLSFGFSVNGKIKVHTTHVVVAMAFLSHEPCRYKRIVDHKVENNRTDNRLINLQIVTPRKNNSKAIDKSKTTSKFTGVSIH